MNNGVVEGKRETTTADAPRSLSLKTGNCATEVVPECQVNITISDNVIAVERNVHFPVRDDMEWRILESMSINRLNGSLLWVAVQEDFGSFRAGGPIVTAMMGSCAGPAHKK